MRQLSALCAHTGSRGLVARYSRARDPHCEHIVRFRSSAVLIGAFADWPAPVDTFEKSVIDRLCYLTRPRAAHMDAAGIALRESSRLVLIVRRC
jgi:hypothetical protein